MANHIRMQESYDQKKVDRRSRCWNQNEYDYSIYLAFRLNLSSRSVFLKTFRKGDTMACYDFYYAIRSLRQAIVFAEIEHDFIPLCKWANEVKHSGNEN
jgi:hypothetical protein